MRKITNPEFELILKGLIPIWKFELFITLYFTPIIDIQHVPRKYLNSIILDQDMNVIIYMCYYVVSAGHIFTEINQSYAPCRDISILWPMRHDISWTETFLIISAFRHEKLLHPICYSTILLEELRAIYLPTKGKNNALFRAKITTRLHKHATYDWR